MAPVVLQYQVVMYPPPLSVGVLRHEKLQQLIQEEIVTKWRRGVLLTVSLTGGTYDDPDLALWMTTEANSLMQAGWQVRLKPPRRQVKRRPGNTYTVHDDLITHGVIYIADDTVALNDQDSIDKGATVVTNAASNQVPCPECSATGEADCGQGYVSCLGCNGKGWRS